jgi:hypothetical protein
LEGYSGLVLQQEIDFLRATSQFEPQVGDSVTVYVENVRVIRFLKFLYVLKYKLFRYEMMVN